VEGIETNKIRILDPAMANQIAAGEVVENPASVVKELLENSLDAEARRVTVTVDGSGSEFIRIADDGVGMSADDALLAVERHATSKVRHPEDLTAISTLGFRGEALPSIVSVSRCLLVTKPRGAVAGTELWAEPGQSVQTKPTGAPAGTRIEVRDLFFNTPARKKFLKSTAAENARITDVFTRLALTRPDVDFTLIRNNKEQRHYLRQSSLEERVREVIGAKVSLREGEAQVGAISAAAWLSGPEDSRTGARGLHLMVNGRLVRDPGLLRAIWFAYQGTLEQGHYPLGVVSLTMPPDGLDVNVHPQKAEVRFVDRGAVHGVVSRVVAALLQQRMHYLGSSDEGSQGGARGAPSPWSPPGVRQQSFSGGGGGQSWRESVAVPPAAQPNLMGSPPVLGAPPAARAEPPSDGEAPVGARRGGYGSLRYLGSAGVAWLVCEGPEGLVVVDQHAAHERITFERLRRGYRERRPEAQQLLVPEQAEVSPREMELLSAQGEELSALGFDVAPFGETAVKISAVPAVLSRADPRRLLDEVLAELVALQTPLSGAMDRLLARLACHGSVRAGTRLAPEEVATLLQDLDKAELGGHCPHGRPVAVPVSWVEIERRLGRRT
jgi:DNA mismatch repair protein MutL